MGQVPNLDEPKPKKLDYEFRIPKSWAVSEVASEACEHWLNPYRAKIFASGDENLII